MAWMTENLAINNITTKLNIAASKRKFNIFQATLFISQQYSLLPKLEAMPPAPLSTAMRIFLSPSFHTHKNEPIITKK